MEAFLHVRDFDCFKELQISTRERDLYVRHFELLRKWNSKLGLVSRQTINDSLAIHYGDSLYISEFASQFVGDRQVVDIGTGAGFPGMVFSIRYPKHRVTLYESQSRKRAFLKAAIADLGLQNVEIRESGPKSFANQLIFARAVFNKDQILELIEKQIDDKSIWILNTSTKEPFNSTKLCLREKHIYQLPLSAGERLVSAISRGTK